jgi:hypothetical protein
MRGITVRRGDPRDISFFHEKPRDSEHIMALTMENPIFYAESS